MGGEATRPDSGGTVTGVPGAAVVAPDLFPFILWTLLYLSHIFFSLFFTYAKFLSLAMERVLATSNAMEKGL